MMRLLLLALFPTLPYVYNLPPLPDPYVLTGSVPYYTWLQYLVYFQTMFVLGLACSTSQKGCGE